jgi:hypothetical protein
MLISQFVLQPVKLLDVHARDARHIFAARSWCILRHAGHDPIPRLLEFFSCGTIARRFGLLMETLTFIWPEPFAIHRPCCQTASLDETILIRALQLASINARPSFDSFFREMLAEDARSMLFARARQLYLPTDGDAMFQ